MYDVMRWNLDCFWMECSASGPLGVWMETAYRWTRSAGGGIKILHGSTHQAQKARHGCGEGLDLAVRRRDTEMGDGAEGERPLGGPAID